MNDNITTYLVHEDKMKLLEKKLNRVKNKCMKYGNDFSYEVVGTEFKYVNVNCERIRAKFFLVQAHGTVIHNGWKFIATIDHTHSGGNIIRQADFTTTIPQKYFTCEGTCEHCKTQRYRKYTCLIQNIETGEFKQVGKSCLQEYTNGIDAEMITSMMSGFEALDDGEFAAPTSGCVRYYETEEVLCYAAECVKHFGYRGTSSYESTSCLVKKLVIDKNMNLHESNFNPMSDENNQQVKDMLSFIQSEEDDSSDSYVHNLKVLCSEKYIGFKDFGIVVSAVPHYLRSIERAEAKKQYKDKHNASTHVGNVGDKIDIDVASARLLFTYDTMYGTNSAYQFIDNNQNVYIWYTSSYVDVETVEHVRGTVKEHSEYRDVKQTVLTRCKVTYKPEDEQEHEPGTFDLDNVMKMMDAV